MVTIKVKRSTGRYSQDNYNLHVYKNKPGSHWNLVDGARNAEQAKHMVTSQPPGCALIVKNTAGGEFKYWIYTNETLLQKRYAQIRAGARFN